MAPPRRTESQYGVIRTLVEYRQKIGMSMTQCSRLMGIDNSRLSQIEIGSRAPSMATVFKYAAALGLELKLQFREEIAIDPLLDKNGNPRNREKRTVNPMERGALVARVPYAENKFVWGKPGFPGSSTPQPIRKEAS